MKSDALAVATPDAEERTLAGGLNFAAIVFPYVAPVVGLTLSGGSPFVRFSAYRCLIEQVVRTVLIGLIVVASLSYSIYSLVQDGVFKDGIDLSKIDWVAILIKSAVTWLAFGLWAVWNTISSIRDGIQALAGKMPIRLGWIGRLAAKWAGIGRPAQS